MRYCCTSVKVDCSIKIEQKIDHVPLEFLLETVNNNQPLGHKKKANKDDDAPTAVQVVLREAA